MVDQHAAQRLVLAQNFAPHILIDQPQIESRNAKQDYAAIGNISGDIKIETEAAGGGTTTTDTTDNWADAETHKLCAYVSSAGVVTYKEDGAAPTATAAYSFSAGLPVVPTVYLRHDSDIANATIITKWEVGYQQ